METIEYAKKYYGESFHLNSKIPEYMKAYEYISDAENISLLQYFYIRYTDSGFYKKSTVRNDLLLGGGFFLFFLTANSFLLYLLFFCCDHQKHAPQCVSYEVPKHTRASADVSYFQQMTLVHLSRR